MFGNGRRRSTAQRTTDNTETHIKGSDRKYFEWTQKLFIITN